MTLAEFVLKLGTDPAYLNEFRNSPLKTLCAANLSESDMQAVISGDPAKIKAAVGGVDPKLGTVTVVVVVAVIR